MINFLIKKFIKDYKNTQDTKVRNAYGKFAGIVGIICNAVLFSLKITAGTLFGSVSITADAVNNLSDASSSVISLAGFKLSEKPADEDHPYGHGRYEYLSGLIVAVLIMVIGVELFKSSLEKVINPSPVDFSWISVCILTFSILLKLWMAFFNYGLGKKIKSATLTATGADSRNDVITTTAVLAAALISYFSGFELDGWMGIFVSLFILYSGIGIVKDTLDPLLGKAPDKEFVENIKNKILSYPGVLGTHDLLVHDYGPGRQFASVHVEMAAEEDVIESHDVLDNIERDFLNEGLHMIVHFDPIVTSDSKVSNLRKWLSKQVAGIDENLTIHDLRVVPGVTHTNVIFDCVVPFDFNMAEGRLKNKICEIVN
ncbi:MAG: cation diffusion facilitator family transporter, partial [Oscillospiraceae bacterium]|nr:cation diffusion facilitator family transporter [Oscillospiraceae bacterium]